uniref:CSON013577 protein n=1 Tax=Culicoides sonorensis TaxID=179676 RepID=A0A336MKJ3_CULSO
MDDKFKAADQLVSQRSLPDNDFSPPSSNTRSKTQDSICSDDGAVPVCEIKPDRNCGKAQPPKLIPRPDNKNSPSGQSTPSSTKSRSITSLQFESPSLQIGAPKRPNEPPKSLKELQSDAMNDLF